VTPQVARLQKSSFGSRNISRGEICWASLKIGGEGLAQTGMSSRAMNIGAGGGTRTPTTFVTGT
jgi:hypothetical protein